MISLGRFLRHGLFNACLTIVMCTGGALSSFTYADTSKPAEPRSTRPVYSQPVFLQPIFAQPVTTQPVAPGSHSLSVAFPEPRADFAGWVSDVEQWLLQNNDLNRTKAQIQLNAPFFLDANSDVPYRGRFLLIHGLSDSAFVWHDFGKVLANMGFDVRAILLSGHGTTPERMLSVNYRHWIAETRAQIQLWSEPGTPLYLGGFSMGGVLATAMALEKPDIAGLFLISPAFHSRLNHMLRWSWLYQKVQPWVFGTRLTEDNPVKYNSIAVNAGTQYYRTTRYLKKRWKRRTLDMPVLVIAANDDSVVDVDYVRDIFATRFTAPHSELILYTDPSVSVPRERETHRSGATMQRRILNQSHLSLTNGPDNPVYGEQDPVLVCNGNEYPIFRACMMATGHWFGAQHTASPDGVPVARSTYNPDMPFVIDALRRVFE